MTGRLKTMDKENEIESDWKFAAMVIDRWSKIRFSFFPIWSNIFCFQVLPHHLYHLHNNHDGGSLVLSATHFGGLSLSNIWNISNFKIFDNV